MLFVKELPLDGVEALTAVCPLAGLNSGRPGYKMVVVVECYCIVKNIIVGNPKTPHPLFGLTVAWFYYVFQKMHLASTNR